MLRTKQLQCNNNEAFENIVPHLRGKIFHITTEQAFKQIQRDGKIRNNKDGSLGFNSNSEASFGRNRGWVCLFDFRDEETIVPTLSYYAFHSPPFKSSAHVSSDSRIVYIFLNQESYSHIIPNDVAWKIYQEEGGQYPHRVPKTECWYPGDIPLTCIDNALLVSVRKSVGIYE
jgi:hypothetical protein